MPPSASALAAFGLKPAPKPVRLVRHLRLSVSFTPENPCENAQARAVFNAACDAGLLEALLERYPYCMDGSIRALLLELVPEQASDPNRVDVLKRFKTSLKRRPEKAKWFIGWADPYICLLDDGKPKDPELAINEAFHQLQPLALYAGRLDMSYELPRRRTRIRRPAKVKPLQHV